MKNGSILSPPPCCIDVVTGVGGNTCHNLYAAIAKGVSDIVSLQRQNFKTKKR